MGSMNKPWIPIDNWWRGCGGRENYHALKCTHRFSLLVVSEQLCAIHFIELIVRGLRQQVIREKLTTEEECQAVSGKRNWEITNIGYWNLPFILRWNLSANRENITTCLSFKDDIISIRYEVLQKIAHRTTWLPTHLVKECLPLNACYSAIYQFPFGCGATWIC